MLPDATSSPNAGHRLQPYTFCVMSGPRALLSTGGQLMSYLIMVVPCLLVGFLAGLLTFRRKQQWCARCGAMLTCPHTGCEARSDNT